MNWDPSPEIKLFREEVRAFARASVPDDIRLKFERGYRLGRDDYTRWYQILAARGWSAPAWPKEHGGPGWSPLQRLIFDDEMLLAGAPRIISAGINMLGPVLIAFGTEEQKRCYLPAILRTETWWAQGFSEPEAGSDLASLRTRAVPDGDDFIVTGQKSWSSYGHFSDRMFTLVRTDPAAKPQRGISFLMIDLNAPGVEVRPVRTIDGGTDLNEVWLDAVRVPRANLVGALDDGWTCAKYLLTLERTTIAGIGACKQQLRRARMLCAATKHGGRPLIEHPSFAERMALLEVDVMALEFTALRMLGANAESGSGAEASLLKIRGTEVRQAIYAFLLDVAGPAAVPWREEAMHLGDDDPAVAAELAPLAANYLDSRKLSIYGGTNEVQRNIAARMVLRP